MKQNSRRDFIRNASIGATLGLGIPSIVSAAFEAEKPKKISLKQDDVILFQGDSITDAGRKRDDKDANKPAAFGSGYAFLAASELLFRQAGKNLRIYNRGISGNKVYQLAERWDADCFDIKPTVLSVLIGVNDFWHTLNGAYSGTIKTYRDDFTKLLERTKQQLPNIKLVIGEPYAVKGIKAVDERWYPAFDEYRYAAKEIAAKFNAAFIPYQSIYDNAQKTAPGAYWTGDGVHPAMPGAALMANAWLQVISG